MIRLERVDLGYDGRLVLRDLNIAIAPGEVFGLVGPNGSGKTTLLRAISGRLSPQDGVIYLDGRRLSELAPRELARELAALEQEISCSFDFTVREIVELGRLPHRARWQRLSQKDHEIVTRALELTHTLEFAERPIHTLSSGERQRVWIALALAQEPKVLLFDEPTAHLDLNYQIEIMELIRSLATAQSLTVLVSLHDLNLALRYADRIALLSEGRLLAVGEPERVLTEELIALAFHTRVRIVDGTGERYIVPVRSRQGVCP
uniref:Ferric enterobactin transport ATP-binding protein n=2 Tax=Candidatus Bipolaricaulota TaxID=67810 RepID=H5SI83_9BACT|nr:ferric enterobactin transport ATP-binding protein [uncultured Acetothermia bacterium]BAL55869.1 ferric enterobactin transport ATP-binding protein [uncultured Acetothermia bacterium]BAL57110.1 ferric enterobactin transport ATP-binding protein [uncultured Acetothermia bacterium]BAL58819.1 ferric enterobactin transport ATP-binding protein [Candidatus Acetothermum autotrophicum]